MKKHIAGARQFVWLLLMPCGWPLPALAQPPADVTGRWVGNIEMTVPGGEKHNDPLTIELTQSGEACSGKSVRDCLLKQRQLTFKMPLRTGAEIRFKLELIDDTHIEGTASFGQDGVVTEGVSATVKLVKEGN